MVIMELMDKWRCTLIPSLSWQTSYWARNMGKCVSFIKSCNTLCYNPTRRSSNTPGSQVLCVIFLSQIAEGRNIWSNDLCIIRSGGMALNAYFYLLQLILFKSLYQPASRFYQIVSILNFFLYQNRCKNRKYKSFEWACLQRRSLSISIDVHHDTVKGGCYFTLRHHQSIGGINDSK